MGTSVSGIFGADPYELAMRRQQQIMSPITQASNPYERIGAALGTALGAGLFGLRDPQLEKATNISNIFTDIMKDVDPTKPEYGTKLTELATTLAQRGYGREAAMAAAEANKFIGQVEDRNLRRQEIEARTKAVEAQAASTETAAEERRTKITTIGTTSKRLTTYRKGTDPTIYVMNEKGEEEKYKPTIHGGYEIAEDRRTPPAPRPVYQRDAFQNVYQMNPDGTKTLVIPGLVPPGQIPQAAPGAAPATGKLKYEPGKGLVGGNK